MRTIILLLILVSFSLQAKEVVTDCFIIQLPDKFHVESDKKSRVLAFTEKGPYSFPFLAIEFGERYTLGYLKKRANHSLKELNISLSEIKCPSGCKAFYAENESEQKGKPMYTYHYVAESNKLVFIISYIDVVSLEAGRDFVHNLAEQILKNGI